MEMSVSEIKNIFERLYELDQKDNRTKEEEREYKTDISIITHNNLASVYNSFRALKLIERN